MPFCCTAVHDLGLPNRYPGLLDQVSDLRTAVIAADGSFFFTHGMNTAESCANKATLLSLADQLRCLLGWRFNGPRAGGNIHAHSEVNHVLTPSPFTSFPGEFRNAIPAQHQVVSWRHLRGLRHRARRDHGPGPGSHPAHIGKRLVRGHRL